MDSFLRLVGALAESPVKYVLIGVAGANYYAEAASTLFTTKDRDLFLPADAENLLEVWRACERAGLELWAGDEPLGEPVDRLLAERVVETRALTRATDGRALEVDLALVMAGFDFDEVWNERRLFAVEGVAIPVARLRHIIESKAKANRPKDRLFLETHAEALEKLIGGD
jgi:hypothetical protein